MKKLKHRAFVIELEEAQEGNFLWEVKRLDGSTIAICDMDLDEEEAIQEAKDAIDEFLDN